MSQAARETTATRALLRRLDEGVTGRLWLGEDDDAIVVYTMNGAVVAADARQDADRILKRLVAQGLLEKRKARTMSRSVASGASVYATLFEALPGEPLEKVLFERFRENLSRFVGRDDEPQFEPMKAIFLENLQFGHDTSQLIRDCVRDWEAASSVPDDAEIGPGPEEPHEEEIRRIRKALGKGAKLGAFASRLAMEPIKARALLARLLEAGYLQRTDEAPAPEPEPVEEPPPPVDEEDIADEVTAQGYHDVSTDLEEYEPPTEELGAAEARELADAIAAHDDPQASETGAGDLSSLQAWMDHGVESTDDLEAFSDHDEVRGSEGEGTFSTEQHNLDRVEVVAAAVPEEEEILEADEAPQARFAAPQLSEDEAIDKVTVANDVLSVFSEVWDEDKGNGAGVTTLQLLVEGCPTRYTTVFQSALDQRTGQLRGERVLRNLGQRPSTEHRNLLNDALVDLIERALSAAADELSDDKFDHAYERVAGYRQRLGL